ncbi:MAG TPA: hypothetical protein VK548_30010 [Candidatus Acidoferrum sp.]|nr:hypothetical protein [Candidatus Acidoferrum sp.]
MKPIVVVDTNVAVVANRREAVSPACVIACVAQITAITRDEKRVAIDLEGLILREYMKNLSLGGQPGVGDAFMKWLHQNQAVVERCEKVRITTMGTNNEPDFPAFPDDRALAAFDPADRKFVAVARAHPQAPPILEATDSKWWGWRDALQRHGVTVQFLCEAEIRATYDAKTGGRRRRTQGG